MRLLVLTWFYFVPLWVAHAQISAEVRVSYHSGPHLLQKKHPLTGGNSLSSSVDAFVESESRIVELSETIRWYLSKLQNPVQISAYAKALFHPKPETLFLAEDRHYLALDARAAYNKVRLNFGIQSRQNRLTKIAVAFPTLLNSAFQMARNNKGRISVEIATKKLSPGTYPVLFTAHERDCQLCKGVAHLILVRVPSSCLALSPNPSCRRKKVLLSRLDLQIAAVYRGYRNVAEDSQEQFLAGWKQVLKAANPCGQLAPDNHQNLSACLRKAGGFCPHMAYGAPAASCKKLERHREKYLALTQKQRKIEQFFTQIDCCKP